MRVLPAAVVRIAIDLLYKYSAIPKAAELRGARRIEAFFKHGVRYLVLSR